MQNRERILASSDIVLQATKDKFGLKQLDPIKVKGKENLIEIYAITGGKITA